MHIYKFICYLFDRRTNTAEHAAQSAHVNMPRCQIARTYGKMKEKNKYRTESVECVTYRPFRLIFSVLFAPKLHFTRNRTWQKNEEYLRQPHIESSIEIGAIAIRSDCVTFIDEQTSHLNQIEKTTLARCTLAHDTVLCLHFWHAKEFQVCWPIQSGMNLNRNTLESNALMNIDFEWKFNVLDTACVDSRDHVDFSSTNRTSAVPLGLILLSSLSLCVFNKLSH